MGGTAGSRMPSWPPRTFLGRLAPETRVRLLEAGVRREVQNGRRLFVEGDSGTHVELLLSGFVKVTTVAEGTEALMAIRVAGDFVGEGALTGQPRIATVVACGPVVSCVLTGDVFQRLLSRYPDASRHLTAVMADKLRWSNQRRAEFAAFSAEVRLARVLAEIADICGTPTGDGIVIGVPLSQVELSTMIGASEATVQKAMRELRRANLVQTGYRQTIVRDVATLRSTVDE